MSSVVMPSRVKERPILFSGAMVAAILSGAKTQTRRILKPQPPSADAAKSRPYSIGPRVARSIGMYLMDDHDRLPKEPGVFDAYGSVGFVRDTCGQTEWACPYGVPGDRLWVQESHQALSLFRPKRELQVRYGADQAVQVLPLTEAELAKFDARSFPYRAQPGRFLYRSLSRITLEITEIRVERLDQITHADARAEGIQVVTTDRVGDIYGLPNRPELNTRTPIGSFGRLWKSINGEDSFKKNPWVWVVSFKRVEA